MIGRWKDCNEHATWIIHLGSGNAAALDRQKLGQRDVISRKGLSHLLLFCFWVKGGLRRIPPLIRESKIKLDGILNIK